MASVVEAAFFIFLGLDFSLSSVTPAVVLE